MPLGIAGIVTNTVVLNQLMPKYKTVINLIDAYLKMTDKPVVVEIDGHTVEELLEVGRVFHKMRDDIILKVPCSVNGLKAFAALKEEGVETYCTTVFSLTQAAAVAHLEGLLLQARALGGQVPVSNTPLTLPTIYSV